MPSFFEDSAATAGYAARIFDAREWSAEEPLRVVLIGSDFQIRVWESLLKIPMGKAVTYSDIACDIGQPTASRAVGAAVGRNPISFVVPCHRALGKSGALTGYHWGLTRKRAMLGWERSMRAGHVAQNFLGSDGGIGVELVDHRHAGRQVDREDLFAIEPVEHHQQRAQRIAVGGNQDLAAAQHARQDVGQ
jgi:O-6-methylguanine DNA methyltransferase